MAIGSVAFIPQSLRVDEGLRLRRLETDDAAEMFMLVDKNRDHIQPYTYWPEYETVERMASEIESANRYAEDFGRVMLGIERAGHLTGTVTLHSRMAYRANLGYWIGKDSQGGGVATQSARRMIDWGFQDWELDVIEMRIVPDNTRSQRVAHRLGARLVGCTMHAGNRDEQVKHDVFKIYKDSWNRLRS